MTAQFDPQLAEARFRAVFSHLGAVTAYARRRGSPDADAIAAEAMTIAWRRLADVPADDPLPWLYATARNLVLAEARRSSRRTVLREPEQTAPAPAPHVLEPQLEQALRSLRPLDREALLLIAWEDLTPSQAARTLGLSPIAFRVRLLRARRRLRARLDAAAADDARRPAHLAHVDVEGT
jgi:RNA polymerase sigma factor (sigma-70 family)